MKKGKEKRTGVKTHRTMPMSCREGRCRYKHRQAVDDCIDCDMIERIENDLLRESIADVDNDTGRQ